MNIEQELQGMLAEGVEVDDLLDTLRRGGYQVVPPEDSGAEGEPGEGDLLEEEGPPEEAALGAAEGEMMPPSASPMGGPPPDLLRAAARRAMKKHGMAPEGEVV